MGTGNLCDLDFIYHAVCDIIFYLIRGHITVEILKVEQGEISKSVRPFRQRPIYRHRIAGSDPSVAVVPVNKVEILGFVAVESSYLLFCAIYQLFGAVLRAGVYDIVKQQGHAALIGNLNFAAVHVEHRVLRGGQTRFPCRLCCPGYFDFGIGRVFCHSADGEYTRAQLHSVSLPVDSGGNLTGVARIY